MNQLDGYDGDGWLARVSRRRFLALVGLSASASLMAACQPAPPPAPKPTSAPAAAPGSAPAGVPTSAPAAAPAAQPTTAPAAAGRPGGELVVANLDEPVSLDPLNMNGFALPAANLVYDRLVMLDNNLKVHPALADSWEASPDGKAYTFKLKRNAKFHDGTPFNAEAVKFNLDRLTTPGLKGNFKINIGGFYERTEVVDEFTARVQLKQAFAPFLFGLAEGLYAMVSPTAFQKFGKDYDRNPVGTGPFIFEEWVSKSHVAARKNPDYNWASSMFKHQGPAYLDRVSVRLIPDAQIRITTVETGEVHFAVDIPPDQLTRLQQVPKVQVISISAPGPSGKADLNARQPPLDDLRVRQAMNWAMDKEEMCKILFNGAFTPARTPLQPGTFGYDESLSEIYPRTDLDKARQLLDEAGWKPGADGIREKDGKKLEVTVNIVSSSIQALPIKWAEVYQAQLREVGIQYTPKQFDTAALFATLTEGSEMVTFSPGSASVDPDEFRSLLHSAFIGKSAAQRTGYKDPHLDELLEQGAAEQDQTKRKAIYREIQEIMLKQALIVPMWVRKNTYLQRDNVRDVIIDWQSWPGFYDAWLA